MSLGYGTPGISTFHAFTHLSLVSISGSGFVEDDPQFVPGELHGRYLPGEALEECGEPFGVRLLF